VPILQLCALCGFFDGVVRVFRADGFWKVPTACVANKLCPQSDVGVFPKKQSQGLKYIQSKIPLLVFDRFGFCHYSSF